MVTVLPALLVAVLAAPASADQDLGLYEATLIVSGQAEETRSRALAQGLREVLVKVSGDPSIVDEPGLARMSDGPASVLAGYSYSDRLRGVPLHDDRANRHRPYDLTFRFEPARIDAQLRALGRQPWPQPRPVIALFLTVDFNQARYVLARDGLHGRDQRRALTSASQLFGLPVVLPREVDLAGSRLFFGTIPDTALPDLALPAAEAGGTVPLAGTLIWDADAVSWVADWRLDWQGQSHEWGVDGVTFDQAFRTALRGALQILSGHGRPD